MWVGDAPPAQNGVVVLGTPIGGGDFVKAHAEKRLGEEQMLLDRPPDLPDLQAAWLLLTYSAVPRANHLIRIVPPSVIRDYAMRHDEALWACFCRLIEGDSLAGDTIAQQVASLPARFGGLGVRSAVRTSPAAYFASWVDSLPALTDKDNDLAQRIVSCLEHDPSSVPCLAEAAEAKQLLVDDGAEKLPEWREAMDRTEPPVVEDLDAGEFRKGWQSYTSSFRETSFLETVVLPASSCSRRATRLSQCGPGAGAWLSALPTHWAVRIKPLRMQVALRRRRRWPLPLECQRCNGKACRSKLDPYGDHWASCNKSGRLQRRSKPLERTWARVFREARARVVENCFLRDTALPDVDAADGRRLEIVATGLPLHHGVPLGVDVTMVSPLHTDGTVWAGADTVAGTAIKRAERNKERTYPELVDSSVLRLVTLACETGGRWSQTTADLTRQLATARSRDAPSRLRLAASLGWQKRWWAMLAVAAQDALASTLVDDAVVLLDGNDGLEPLLCDVLCDAVSL